MMRKTLMAVILLLIGMTAFAGNAIVTFELKDRDRADLFLNGKKAGEIRGGTLKKAMVEGKYKLEVRADLEDKSFWYYSDTIEVFDGDMTTIPIKMELKYTEEYYIQTKQYENILKHIQTVNMLQRLNKKKQMY